MINVKAGVWYDENGRVSVTGKHIEDLLNAGLVARAITAFNMAGKLDLSVEKTEWLTNASEASKYLHSEQRRALEALNRMPSGEWVDKLKKSLEFKLANVNFSAGKAYLVSGNTAEAISFEEAEQRRLNLLSGRKKFVKGDEITPLVKKEKRPNNKFLVFAHLEANGEDTDLSEAFPDLSESTLKVYRYDFMKLNGTFKGRTRKPKVEVGKVKRTRTARGSGNQERVFEFLEAHGHEAEVPFTDINQGSVAVYRSLFRKAKGITVKRGRK